MAQDTTPQKARRTIVLSNLWFDLMEILALFRALIQLVHGFMWKWHKIPRVMFPR